MSWGSGDDWLWQFRKVEDKIQVVRRNVRFTAAKGSPEEKAVHLAYTDSVLFSLPIISTSPGGGSVIEFGNLHERPAADRQRPARVHVRTGPVELGLGQGVRQQHGDRGGRDLCVARAAGDRLGGRQPRGDDQHPLLDQPPAADRLPAAAGRRPRGPFPTVIKDYSKKYETDRFVRYVNRWDLRKADPVAELSPPKKPIVFWLEKTIPFEYRKPIREGILEWNKAFEKIGLANAIEVRQQPDDADWDPEDINYNTFRWITAARASRWGRQGSTRSPARSSTPTSSSTPISSAIGRTNSTCFA